MGRRSLLSSGFERIRLLGAALSPSLSLPTSLRQVRTSNPRPAFPQRRIFHFICRLWPAAVSEQRPSFQGGTVLRRRTRVVGGLLTLTSLTRFSRRRKSPAPLGPTGVTVQHMLLGRWNSHLAAQNILLSNALEQSPDPRFPPKS